MKKSCDDVSTTVLVAVLLEVDLEAPVINIWYDIANMGQNPSKHEMAMDKEIEKVQKELVTEEEMQKVLNQIENDFVTSSNSVAGIAERLSNYEK